MGNDVILWLVDSLLTKWSVHLFCRSFSVQNFFRQFDLGLICPFRGKFCGGWEIWPSGRCRVTVYPQKAHSSLVSRRLVLLSAQGLPQAEKQLNEKNKVTRNVISHISLCVVGRHCTSGGIEFPRIARSCQQTYSLKFRSGSISRFYSYDGATLGVSHRGRHV